MQRLLSQEAKGISKFPVQRWFPLKKKNGESEVLPRVFVGLYDNKWAVEGLMLQNQYNYYQSVKHITLSGGLHDTF